VVCVDHPRTVIELEQNIKEEIEAILMDVTRRVMENWLFRVQYCTLENGINNGDFFLNNQQDALIIQIYCYKILHVSRIFSAHHQEFFTVHSTLVSFMQGFNDRFQVESVPS
jgi:hypothetical protein